MQTLPGLVRAAATERPRALAVVGDQSFAYAELVAEADGVARLLAAAGIEPRAVVGVASARSARLVALGLGVMAAGAVYLPLDPLYPDRLVADMAAAADPRLVLLDRRAGGRAPERCVVVDVAALRPVECRGPGAAVADPCAPAYAMFTSGSTGSPKGVLLGHAGLAQYARALTRRVGPRRGEACLGVAPAGFSSSVRQLWVPLTVGATVVVPSDDVVREPFAFCDLARRHRVTHLDLTPSYWRALLDAVGHTATSAAFASVRRVLFASERLDADLVRRTFAACPGATVWNLYGCTETTGVVAAHRMAPDDPVADPVPIGRPLGHVRVAVAPEGRARRSRRRVGRLVVTGAAVAVAGLGARAIGRAGDGRRRLDTGDRVELRDGLLVWLGRADRVSKVRGMRVHHDAVEAQLCAHDDVRRAAVLAATERGVTAAVQPQPGRRPDPVHIRRWLRARLPEHLVPASIQVIADWPCLSNGKTDHRALADGCLGAVDGPQRRMEAHT